VSVAAQAKLSSRQRGFLLGRGYLVVRSLLDQAVLARIRDRLDGLVRVTVAAWANDPSLDTTEACVVAEFDPADPGFAPCHQHPLLADAASLVLGDPWHVRSLDLRAPIPGAGEQGLHPDYAERRTEGPWQTLSAMWCVTPFTRDSGPLRVIPGSHRRGRAADRYGAWLCDRHGPAS
jgi:ectoine hydroxylase-related dioxygenase (phytanoyl-CoA dioxygenase family)